MDARLDQPRPKLLEASDDSPVFLDEGDDVPERRQRRRQGIDYGWRASARGRPREAERR
jgi:hypothetical protein